MKSVKPVITMWAYKTPKGRILKESVAFSKGEVLYYAYASIQRELSKAGRWNGAYNHEEALRLMRSLGYSFVELDVVERKP